MTTFRDTRDDLTSSVRWQLDGFLDLGPVRYARSGARVTTATLLGTSLYFQAASLRPSDPAGFVLSAGLQVLIGD